LLSAGIKTISTRNLSPVPFHKTPFDSTSGSPPSFASLCSYAFSPFAPTLLIRRGNHESPGPFTLGHLERDIEDLVVVAKYLREVEGYQIDMIV
jgi:hypothetical protein